MMKVFDKLTDRNFEFFAMQHYDNRECCDIEEFKEDLARFKYLKRLFRRYEVHNDLQERLILNHLIVIYNVFGIKAANRMMWFKIDEVHYHYLKPFLVFLNYLDINEKVEIKMDQNVINVLRNV
jgi:hypothetical protein